MQFDLASFNFATALFLEVQESFHYQEEWWREVKSPALNLLIKVVHGVNSQKISYKYIYSGV
jgi:hypothetical protein